MAKNFTFKYQPKTTGLAGVGYPNRSVDIKYDGGICGIITAPNWQSKDRLYRIRLSVKDNENPIGWKWIQLKFKDEDEQVVRAWLKNHSKEILERFEPHFIYED